MTKTATKSAKFATDARDEAAAGPVEKFFVGVKASQKAKPRLAGPAKGSYGCALKLARQLFQKKTGRRAQVTVADGAMHFDSVPVSVTGIKDTQVDFVIVRAKSRNEAWSLVNAC